jgi:biotin operon repressor
VTVTPKGAAAAVSALRTYQTDYADYDAEAWIASVRDTFRIKSVHTVALGLATLSDWSLRGIEISQRKLAKLTGLSQKTVSRCVNQLTEAGLVEVARRFPKSNGHDVTQRPDSYWLVIPGGPTWGMADTGLIGWGDESPYSVSHFSQETSPLHSDGPTYRNDGLFPWERRYIPEVTEESPNPFAWEWDETDWITSPEDAEAPYSVSHFSQESRAA